MHLQLLLNGGKHCQAVHSTSSPGCAVVGRVAAQFLSRILSGHGGTGQSRATIVLQHGAWEANSVMPSLRPAFCGWRPCGNRVMACGHCTHYTTGSRSSYTFANSVFLGCHQHHSLRLLAYSLELVACWQSQTPRHSAQQPNTLQVSMTPLHEIVTTVHHVWATKQMKCVMLSRVPVRLNEMK